MKRSRRPARVRWALAACLVVAAATGTGCGGGGTPGGARGPLGQAGSGGRLSWAVADRPLAVDPLLARTRAERIVCRQLYEPLVEQLHGPFGEVRIEPGIGIPHPNHAGTVWRLRLRSGVRYQDGRRFDAGAVLANVHRWQATSEGQALLPDLVAADSPRPDLVRFFLDRADLDFSADLGSPRLGVVSPRAIGTSGYITAPARAGLGPFELRERSADHALLARNLNWWGTDHGLGPALDQVDLRVAAGAAQRLRMLRSGEVQAADELGSAQIRKLRRDPLLTFLSDHRGEALGLERSVRGIDSAAEIPILSGTWLTTIGAG